MVPKSQSIPPRARSLAERLRPHLQRYSAQQVDQFLDSVHAITRLAPAIPQGRATGSAVRDALSRIHKATEDYLAALDAMPLFMMLEHEPEAPGTMLRKFVAAIERSGGSKAFLDLLDRGERPPPDTATPSAEEQLELLSHYSKERHRHRERWEDRKDNSEIPPGENPGRVKSERAARRWHDDPKQAEYDLHTAKLEAYMVVGRLRDELTGALEHAPIPSSAPGRKAADQVGILRGVAAAWLRIFGESPTSTKFGVFYNVAAEITGQKDPDKGVRSAIAALKQPTK